MCAPKVKMPAAVTPAAAPAAPNLLASEFRMAERRVSQDGTYDANTARSRRTLRTDLKMPSVGTGVAIARM